MELGERALVVSDTGRFRRSPTGSLREIAASHGGYFEPVRDTPALADALHRLVRELRGAATTAPRSPTRSMAPARCPRKPRRSPESSTSFLPAVSASRPDDCLLAAETDHAPWEALFARPLAGARRAGRRARRPRRAHPRDCPPPKHRRSGARLGARRPTSGAPRRWRQPRADRRRVPEDRACGHPPTSSRSPNSGARGQHLRCSPT